MSQALFVNLRDGRSLPFQVPDDFSLQSDEGEGFLQSDGGFLSFPDGTQLWVDPNHILTAFLLPMADGQRIEVGR